MKAFFPITKGTQIKDAAIAFAECSWWNSIRSAAFNQFPDHDIIEYEADYWDVLRKMYQRHQGDARTRWQLAYKDMKMYYAWAFKE